MKNKLTKISALLLSIFIVFSLSACGLNDISNTVDKIEDFAKKHELNTKYIYQETTSVPEGTILKQNRAADSIVAPGVTLVITIAQSPEPTEEDTTQEGEITEDNGMD